MNSTEQIKCSKTKTTTWNNGFSQVVIPPKMIGSKCKNYSSKLSKVVMMQSRIYYLTQTSQANQIPDGIPQKTKIITKTSTDTNKDPV